jgi:hypothetical protein
MAARLSALRAGRLYPQETSWYTFLLEAEATPRAIVRPEGLGTLKKSTSSETRTGDFPACSIVPQPTTLPRAPLSFCVVQTFIWLYFVDTRHILRTVALLIALKQFCSRDNLIIITLLPSIPRSVSGWELRQNGQFIAYIFSCWNTVILMILSLLFIMVRHTITIKE